MSAQTHGKRHTPEYTNWAGMKDRCFRPASKAWGNYGGRGITVCERWINSFENFLADMGPRPTPKHSIDRIDNDGDYEPSNCRWATSAEQGQNKRTNVPVTYQGQNKLLKEWCELLKLNCSRVKHRIRLGWTPAEAFRKPVKDRWTHCQRGHEYTPANTIRNARGRLCRTCRDAYQRTYNKLRRKESA